MGIGSNYISTVLTTAGNTFIDNYNNAPKLPEYLSNFVGTLAESHSFVSNYTFKQFSYDTDRFLRHLDSESDGFAIACGDAITSLFPPVALTNAYNGYTEGKDIYGREMGNGDVALSVVSVVPLGKAFTVTKEFSVMENAAKEGTTVLGHYPQYVKLAESLGARKFQIPTNIWNKMSAAEQWTANTKFLDRMILRGDNIRLATPLNQVKPGSFFQKELNYLFDKGYKVSSDGLWLTK